MNMFIVIVLFVAFIEKFIAGMDPANRKIVPKESFSVELMKELLRTGDRADVHFLVGDKKKLVKAHKAILEKASDVFERMFRYNEANEKAAAAAAGTGSSKKIKLVKVPEVKVPEVEVPDVEVSAFKVMLSFIYATDLSGLNGDNAMFVLYAANIYHLPKLVDSCLNFPIPELNNVFFALDAARFLGEEDFARRCLEHIDVNADALIFSDAFLQIGQESLCEILDRDELMISEEIAIWNAALRWADEKCRQNGIECSAKNRRAMLGPALYKIRFPLIPQKDFTENIVPSGVLEKDEQAGVYQYYSHPDAGLPELDQLQFPTNKRALPALTLQNRWDSASAACHEKLALSEPARLIVQFIGENWEWRSVLAEQPIPKGKSGTFYYEVAISGRRMSGLKIGLATKQILLDNRVWENEGTCAYASCGIFWVEEVDAYYDSDDVEGFDAGNVIGCGVNLANRQIFYTKNGQRLDKNGPNYSLEARLRVDFGTDLFPCISLHTPGTKIESNFGPEFQFNIAAEGS